MAASKRKKPAKKALVRRRTVKSAPKKGLVSRRNAKTAIRTVKRKRAAKKK